MTDQNPPSEGHSDEESGLAPRLRRGWRDWLRRSRPATPPQAGVALKQTIAEMNSRQEDMTFLGEVTRLLQACRTVEEVCNVARDRLQSISPKLSGALFLMSETNEYLENTMTWGSIKPSSVFLAPGDCWALRCGRPHQLGKGQGAIACAHTAAGEGDWHLCVPMMAQGEALGILYFRLDAKRGRRGDDALIAAERQPFYFNVAETLSLALANIRLRETLQHQAIRDPLTGLFNRRYFQETLRRELHRASRGKKPLSVVMLDIDYFKRFNDTFGHDAGDAALKTVGEILLARTRAGDVACRHGGEEFALAFPGLSAEIAADRVEALRREIEEREIHYLGQTIAPVTISAGIAVYPMHAMDMDSLMRVADQALYESKKAGRNRFTMAGTTRRTGDGPPLSVVQGGGGSDERQAAAGGESR